MAVPPEGSGEKSRDRARQGAGGQQELALSKGLCRACLSSGCETPATIITEFGVGLCDGHDTPMFRTLGKPWPPKK